MDKQLNPATGVLTWLAGASPDVLKRCGKSEQMKFAALGATVIIPAAVGFFACWYTVYSLTQQMGIAIMLGVAWSMMLVAIDRAILVTYKKGEKQGSKVLLRMFLAGVAGILVAHVLVLFVFRDIIEDKHNEWRQAKVEHIETVGKAEMIALREQVEAAWAPKISEVDAKINDLTVQRDGIRAEISAIKADKGLEERDQIFKERQVVAERHAKILGDLYAQRDKLNKEYTDEVRGKDGSVAGYGPKAKAIEARIVELNGQIDQITKQNQLEMEPFQQRLEALGLKDEGKVELIKEKEDLWTQKEKDIEVARADKAQLLNLQQEDFAPVNDRREKMEQAADEERARSYDDILSRTEALHEIVMDGVKRGEPSAAIGYLLLVLLFFTLDTIPIITKMMLPAGTYDRILDRDLKDTESLAVLESEERMTLFHQLAAERASEQVQEERLKLQLASVRGAARAKLETFRDIHKQLSTARRDVAAVNAGDLKSISRNMSDSARAEAESALQIMETKFLAQAQNIVDEYSSTADADRVRFDDEEDDVIKLTLQDNGVPHGQNGHGHNGIHTNGANGANGSNGHSHNGGAHDEDGFELDDNAIIDEMAGVEEFPENPVSENDAPAIRHHQANA